MEHPDAPLLVGGVRGIVLASRYLIQPCGSGKSRVTHISRVDMRLVKLTKISYSKTGNAGKSFVKERGKIARAHSDHIMKLPEFKPHTVMSVQNTTA